MAINITAEISVKMQYSCQPDFVKREQNKTEQNNMMVTGYLLLRITA
jgi:heme-binding NEAT domain protein